MKGQRDEEVTRNAERGHTEAVTFGHGYNYLKGSHMEKAGGINTLNTLFFHTEFFFHVPHW